MVNVNINNQHEHNDDDDDADDDGDDDDDDGEYKPHWQLMVESIPCPHLLKQTASLQFENIVICIWNMVSKDWKRIVY